MPRIDLITLRQGSAAEWTSTNPVLALAEPGYESDTGQMKYGDGVTPWVTLPYFADDGSGGGGGDEVWVGPSQPTSPSVELWYDTDATGTPPAGGGDGSFNVKTYGAIGNGVADDTTAIQAALNAARTAGGGTVTIPGGTYKVTPRAHPQNATYAPCLVVGTGTRLLLDPSAVIRLADNTPALAPATMHWLLLNYDIGGTVGDVDISIEGGVFDGNAANQTVLTEGVFLIRTADCQFDNVTVKNCRGTAYAGPEETFHFDAQLGARTVYRNCRVIGDDAGSTASGFSANGSTAIRYSNCLASGMKIGGGFTHNGCSGVAHNQCVAFDNQGGFNSEISTNVSYHQCIAGLASAPNGTAFPYGNAESLGNTGAGFACAYQSQASYIDCIAKHNGGSGLLVADETTFGSAARIVSGEYTHNATAGIYFSDVSAGRSVVTGHPKVTDNATPYALGAAGYQNESGLISTSPAMPASGADFANPFPFPMTVEVTPPANGNLYFIRLGSAMTGRMGGTFHLAPGATIAIHYGEPPTWSWWLGSAPVGATQYIGSTSWDPPSLAQGAQVTKDVTVYTAAAGDPCAVGFSTPLPAGVIIAGAVTATNVVTVTLLNMSGASVDIAAGMIRARTWDQL